MLRSIRWGGRLGAALVVLAAVSADGGAVDSPKLNAIHSAAPDVRVLVRATPDVPTPGYVLLKLHNHEVKWGSPRTGTGAVVRYAFVDRWVVRQGAVNCGTIGPIGGRLPNATVGAADFARETVRAMRDWEAAADVRFEPSDPASADLLIGIQKVPVGIAYTDVMPNPTAVSEIAVIRKAAICFNPTLPWETGFDGDTRTPDIRYVAAHEIGHVLGLDHAWGTDKLMDFNYRETVRAPQRDDLAGAVFLYGRSLATQPQIVRRLDTGTVEQPSQAATDRR